MSTRVSKSCGNDLIYLVVLKPNAIFSAFWVIIWYCAKENSVR